MVMERAILQAIQSKLSTVTELNEILIWNNQLDRLKDDSEDGSKIYNLNLPVLYVEFVSPMEIQQIGIGVRIYDPLYLRLHLLHRLEDAMDGTFEQNLEVFDLKQKIYLALQKSENSKAVALITQSEEQDYSHTNIYHFIMTFMTNYVEDSRQEPFPGTQSISPVQLDLDAKLKIDNDIIRTGTL